MLRQFQPLFPPTAAMLSVKEWGLNKDFVLMPFHAAEQHSKERKNVLAEQSDFPKRPLFVSSAGMSAVGGPSERCHFFWFVFFGQAKKMNIPEGL